MAPTAIEPLLWTLVPFLLCRAHLNDFLVVTIAGK
jgi:hypothetical protein